MPASLHAGINETNWPAKAGQFTFRVIALVPASNVNVFEFHGSCSLRRGQQAEFAVVNDGRPPHIGGCKGARTFRFQTAPFDP